MHKLKGGRKKYMIENNSNACFTSDHLIFCSLSKLMDVYHWIALLLKKFNISKSRFYSINFVSRFPNYLFVYFWHHWMMQFAAAGTIVIYYSRHKTLQNTVWREAKAILKTLLCRNKKYSAMIKPIL